MVRWAGCVDTSPACAPLRSSRRAVTEFARILSRMGHLLAISLAVVPFSGLPVPAAPLCQRGTALAPEVGLEPTTTRLTVACSTIELLRNRRLRGAETTGRDFFGKHFLQGCEVLQKGPPLRVRASGEGESGFPPRAESTLAGRFRARTTASRVQKHIVLPLSHAPVTGQRSGRETLKAAGGPVPNSSAYPLSSLVLPVFSP